MALGLIQLVALKFGGEIWQSFHCYLRTPGYAIPSEAVTRVAIARLLATDFRRVAPHGMITEIQDRIGNLLYTFSPRPERRILTITTAPTDPPRMEDERKPPRDAVSLWEIVTKTLLPGVSIKAGLGTVLAVIRRRVLGAHR